MDNLYTDNNVPIGSRVEAVKRGVGAGSAVGTYVFDNLSLERPGNVVRRTDQIGEPNGWSLTRGFVGGAGVVQIGTKVTECPKLGDWFVDAFDGASTATETMVIVHVGQPFEKEGYWRASVTLLKATVPATA